MNYIENVDLRFLKTTPIEKAKKEEEIKKKCVHKIHECLSSDLSQFKESPLLVQVVCALVEKYSPPNNRKEKLKIDKRNLVLEIFVELFTNLSGDQLKKIEDLIEFFHHSKLIRRLNSVSKFFLKWAFTIGKLF
jgi:hypothetical protein